MRHFFCQCETFHLLCNLLCAKNKMLREKMRLRFETGGGESKFQSVTHLRMMDQWRCQAALLDKIYCLWMFFPSFHPFFYLYQSSVRSQCPNYLREWLPVFTHHISSWKGEKLRNILRIWQVMWLSLLLWTKHSLWYGSSLILFVIFFFLFLSLTAPAKIKR